MNLEQYIARREQIDRTGEFDHVHRNDAPHYVYRYYNDSAPIGHRLLYIGMTKDFVQRDEFHQWRSSWRTGLPITRVEIEEYPTKRDAERAERLAIQYEIPCRNNDHNRNWPTNHPSGGHEPACDPEFARTGTTEWQRMREAMDKLGEILSPERSA